MRESVAVVGSGIAGLSAAHALRKTHRVTLFEAEARFGGHAHTHDVDGQRVDTGFIVLNDRTYPQLRRLFVDLGVEVRPTEMSMSIRCDGCGLEYAGGRGRRGLFAQRRRAADVRYLRMLADVVRFQRAARALLDTPESDAPVTLGQFLDRHGFSQHFVAHYAIPVVSCVWSTGTDRALDYPARYLFAFLSHHGFLTLGDSPQWYTVVGGSRSYVDAVTARIGDVRASTPIRAITRKPDAIELIDDNGNLHTTDRVVIATHADEALALLTDPTDEEQRVLGAFEYSTNRTTLHRDDDDLPSAPNARACWNYRMRTCTPGRSAPEVTYWMNLLQGIESREPFLVTLNAEVDDPLAEMNYTHPVYTPTSVRAQRDLPGLNDDRTVFAGAYHGWGFHEDGCRSGLEAARALGAR